MNRALLNYVADNHSRFMEKPYRRFIEEAYWDSIADAGEKPKEAAEMHFVSGSWRKGWWQERVDDFEHAGFGADCDRVNMVRD